MGIDAVIYAVVDPTEGELARAELFLRDRVNAGALTWGDGPLLTCRPAWYWENAEGPIVSVNNGQRYYGPGYERGDWPVLYVAIQSLRAAFPGAYVLYGGDSGFVEIVDDALLASIWDHFFTDAHRDYVDDCRRSNRSQSWYVDCGATRPFDGVTATCQEQGEKSTAFPKEHTWHIDREMMVTWRSDDTHPNQPGGATND